MVANVDLSLTRPANVTAVANATTIAVRTIGPSARLQRQLQRHLLAASTMVANVDLSLDRPANVTAVANATTIAVRTIGPSARLQRQLQRQLQRPLSRKLITSVGMRSKGTERPTSIATRRLLQALTSTPAGIVAQVTFDAAA